MLRNTACTYEDELKKHPELKESDIQILREWCAKQPHLPKISDVLLAVLLHSVYFSVEATKTKIEAYCTMRTHAHEFFSDRDPVGSKGLRIIFKTLAYVCLRKRTDDDCLIAYSKWVDFNPMHFNYNDFVKYANMVCDARINIEGSSPGCQLVVNVQGLTAGHVSRLSSMGLKKSLLYLQEATPARMKMIHIINVVPAVDIVMRMAKRIVKKEFFGRIHFHSATESLAKFIPLDALPNEDGGNGGNLADLMAETIKVLEDNRAWFQTEEATMRVNESLRPGKGKTTTDVFGVDGTFKKLEFD